MENQQMAVAPRFDIERFDKKHFHSSSNVESKIVRLREHEECIADHVQAFKQKFKQCIARNYHNFNCNVDFLSRELACSHSTLFRYVKKSFGCSTSKYLRNYRLAKALQLIQSGGYSVGEVASLVGYVDAAYFSRVFTKMYGTSPSESFNTPNIRNMSFTSSLNID
jgi:AraC-like DNA-binding protein